MFVFQNVRITNLFLLDFLMLYDGNRERGKDLWTEEEEAELYKEPTHTAVNTIREDL